MSRFQEVYKYISHICHFIKNLFFFPEVQLDPRHKWGKQQTAAKLIKYTKPHSDLCLLNYQLIVRKKF